MPSKTILMVIALVWMSLGGCDDQSSSTSPLGGCGEIELSCDDVPAGQSCPAVCSDPGYAFGACEAGRARRQELQGQQHISLPETIEYAVDPPASGDHRPQWACWGEYSFLPATRWLHNLEHGGIALLYHPCAPQTLIDDLRAFARSLPDDGSGPFRWIMTPYDNLPSAIALVAWEWVYESNCMRPDEMYDFVRARYRQAPEDIVSSGAFSEGYIGR